MQYPARTTTWLCSELVTLTCKNGGENREMVANLEQISPSSAVLLADTAVENGCSVSFVVQGYELTGQVTAETLDDLLGWFLTVELDSATQWSPELFSPEHVLRLEALAQVATSAA